MGDLGSGLVEAPFVGQSRVALVDLLVQRLKDLQAGRTDVARVVVLRGEPGAGKSRVVRELYGRLRESQDGNAEGLGYWPALEAGLSGRGGQGERLPVRKVIGPDVGEFNRPPGHLMPSFFWWPVACAKLPSGMVVQVTQDLYGQFQAHGRFLVRRWKELTSPPEQFTKWMAEAWPRLVMDTAQGKALEAITSFLSNAGVPAADWVVSGAKRALLAWLSKREMDLRVAEGGALDRAGTTAEEICTQLRRLRNPGLPVVLAVEDLHLMGDDLGELLALLAAPDEDWPVLVVATAWGTQGTVLDEWLGTMQEATPGAVEVHEVRDLEKDGLEEILLFYAPNTDPATVAKVVARYRNPLALQLLLADDRIQRSHIRDDALVLTDEELAVLPRDVKGWLLRWWEELPDQARNGLDAACAALPAAVAQSPGAYPFIHGVVAKATGPLLDGEPEVLDGLSQAVSHNWTRLQPSAEAGASASADAMANLADELRAAVAVEQMKDGPLGTQVGQVLQGTRQALQDRIMAWAAEDDPVEALRGEQAGVACRWLRGISEPVERSSAHAIAAHHEARQLAAVYQYATAIACMTEPDRISDLADGLDPGHPVTLDARHNLASWLGRSGRVQDAIAQFEVLVADRVRVLEEEHDDTLSTRSNLAFWLGRYGRLAEAIRHLEAVLAIRERKLSLDHFDTLRTRSNLASQLGRAGQLGEAIRHFEAVLAIRERKLSLDHPTTLTTRSNLARWLGESGRVGDAVTRLESVLADREKVLGPDHPKTLHSRGDLARWVGESGRADDAVERLKALLPDRERVLGPAHPQTLWTRGDLARWVGESGRADEAVERLKALLPDRERVLGPAHPQTLWTRGDLARWVGESGRADDAVERLEALLDDQHQVLDPVHPQILWTRGELARWVGESSRADEAVERLEALLDDQHQVLDPAHPDKLTTRSNHARNLAKSGRVQDAIAHFEALLPNMEGILGSGHPATLRTREYLTSILGESGRVVAQQTEVPKSGQHVSGDVGALSVDSRRRSEGSTRRYAKPDVIPSLGAGHGLGGVAGLAVLLADQVRVLGEADPRVLVTRVELAEWVGRAGDPQGAVSMLECVLVDAVRVLGPGHPLVLQAESALGSWSVACGVAVEPPAVRWWRVEVSRLDAELGPGAAGTLRARAMLAGCLGEAGQVQRARDLYALVVPGLAGVLGAGHRDVLACRNHWAALVGQCGQAEVAAGMVQELLGDMVGVLPAPDPVVLWARANLAHWVGVRGQAGDAAAAFGALVGDWSGAWGAQDPGVLACRNHHASWVGMCGQVGQAEAMCRELLPDRVRVQGAEHPGVLATRHNLACWVAAGGAVEDAAALGRDLLADRVRLLGAEHPDTLAIRADLADWTGQLGDPQVAARQYASLLQDRLRVLGPDHPDTLTTRGALLHWQHEAQDDSPYEGPTQEGSPRRESRLDEGEG